MIVYKSIDNLVEAHHGLSDSDDQFLSMARCAQRDRIHAAAAAFGLKVRPYMHGAGRHEGGYHPGKNKRQGLPIAAIDAQLSDIERASTLLGLPAAILVASQEALGRLVEQRGYELSAAPYAFSNGFKA